MTPGYSPQTQYGFGSLTAPVPARFPGQTPSYGAYPTGLGSTNPFTPTSSAFGQQQIPNAWSQAPGQTYGAYPSQLGVGSPQQTAY